MTGQNQPLPFRWIGGRPCLDFNNTIDWLGLEPSVDERLGTYGDLVEWGVAAEVLSPEAGERLRRMAGQHPEDAERVLARALELRATVHALFFAVASGSEADPTALTELNTWLAETPAEVRAADITPAEFTWAWADRPDDLAAMLAPVAWSAAQLLTSAELPQVKTCGNDTCGWVFLDESRKHNRRWCEMRTCGNRAKARRFYKKQRGATA
jgi:predicted RNA-binding Zn ribbon-like protein